MTGPLCDGRGFVLRSLAWNKLEVSATRPGSCRVIKALALEGLRDAECRHLEHIRVVSRPAPR